MVTGREVHGKAEQARERGDLLQALQLCDEAMVTYQTEGDALGFAEVLASRFLTLRHLFEQTDDKKYLILGKHAAQSSVELAESGGDKSALALPYFNLAKSQETLGQFQEAVENYKKALGNAMSNPPAAHKIEQRPAIIADMKVHLATSEYKAGDKSALERAKQALAELEAHPDIEDYNQHVWVSGGYMRLAEILKEDNPTEAKECLQKAKVIIDADPRLKLRLKQWEKLAK